MRLKLDTATNVRHSLTNIANAVIRGEIDAKQANAAVYACNTALAAIRTAEPEQQADLLAKAKEILDCVPSVIDQ